MQWAAAKYDLIGIEGEIYEAVIEWSGPPKKYNNKTPDLVLILFKLNWGKVWLTNYNAILTPYPSSTILFYKLNWAATDKILKAKARSEKKQPK